MKMTTRPAIVFPLALLTMLAIMTFWINKSVQSPKPKLDGSSRHDPDYVMSNFVTTQTDINGALRYKLAAVEMKHFSDNDTTDLQRPRYTQFSAGKPYTQVEGLRGHVSSDGEQVELFGNVKVIRQAFAEKGEMTVDTDYLKILPDEDIVRTDSPVVIRQAPETVIYATGMIYEKDQRTLTLLHKVRAHYEKPEIKTQSYKSGISKSQKNNQSIIANPTNKTQSNPQVTNQASNTNNARIRRRYE